MKSIRRQLTIRLCVLAAILLPCGALVVYLLARQFLISQFDETLAAKADALISVAEVDEMELEIDPDVQSFAGFGSALTGDFFEVRRPNGEIVLQSSSMESRRYVFSNVPPVGRWQGRVVLPEGNQGRALAVPFIPDGDDTGQFNNLQLVVAGDSTALLQTLHAALIVLLITGTVGLAMAILLIRHGLKRGLQPLDAIAAEVHRMNVDEPGLRLQTAILPKELLGVGEKLNRLLERVEASIARERRFSSHASHELRTPLAELKIMVESMVKWPDEATPERSLELLEVVNELEVLLEKLALLARADAGGCLLQITEVDLASSLERAIGRERDSVESKRLQIRTSIEPGIFQTDPVLWQAILGNLLGNAVAYAPEGSTISVQASPRSLVVSNPAPNLSEDDLDLLFERFWRKSTARESGFHSGLGLAIVQTVARLLNGTCDAELIAGNLSITITWSTESDQSVPD